jgi:hypothetical protein
VVYEISGFTDKGFILVRVYFGSANPLAPQLAQAQTALDRLEYRPVP